MLPKARRLTKLDFSGIRPRIIFRGGYVDVAVVISTVTKFACVIPKKRVKRAVDRNRIKRRIYSAVEKTPLPTKNYYIILYPRQNALNSSFTHIEKEIREVFATL